MWPSRPPRQGQRRAPLAARGTEAKTAWPPWRVEQGYGAGPREGAVATATAGWEPTAATAEAILRFCRERMPAYSRIRRLEFSELPKTISGKIRRVELREREQRLSGGADAPSRAFSEDDFPHLKG